MEYWYIDRVENGLAVCERPDGVFEPISISLLPKGAGEGAALIRKQDGRFDFVPEQEAGRKRTLSAMQENLFHK